MPRSGELRSLSLGERDECLAATRHRLRFTLSPPIEKVGQNL